MQREYVCGQKRYLNVEATSQSSGGGYLAYLFLLASIVFAGIMFI